MDCIYAMDEHGELMFGFMSYTVWTALGLGILVMVAGFVFWTLLGWPSLVDGEKYDAAV